MISKLKVGCWSKVLSAESQLIIQAEKGIGIPCCDIRTVSEERLFSFGSGMWMLIQETGYTWGSFTVILLIGHSSLFALVKKC